MSINENRLRNIVRGELRNMGFGLNEGLNKGDTFSLSGMKPEQMARIIASKYGVNPNDFVVKRGMLTYEPKKVAKQRISKPEDMSVDDYKNKCVIPLKPELKDIDGEEWRPIKNMGCYFGGDVDYSNYYEVSNLGRVRNIDFGNAAGSNVSYGYDAPTRKAMQYHLNHKSGMNTCPDIKYMVADAFLGEHNPKDNMVIHIDGDYHNNRAENLKWVPRSRGRFHSHNEVKEELTINENVFMRHIHEAIKSTLRNLINESFKEKYENAIDTIDYYRNLKENGEKLSQEQYEQISDIVNFLKTTNTNDNPCTIEWIETAEELLSRNNISEKKNNIEIKPENKGKFTATKKRTGKTTDELLHSKNPKTRQRANFARMAKRGWKPLDEESLVGNENHFGKFVDVLEKCGWSYTDFNDVRSKSTGQTGTRFVIERDKDNSCDLSELQQNLKRVIPEKLLVFSTGQHRYAPELSKKSVILLNDLSNRQLDEEWDVAFDPYHNNPSPDEKAWDNYWSEEHAFDPDRNDNYEGEETNLGPNTDYNYKDITIDNAGDEMFSDTNNNVYDYRGMRSMEAMSDNPDISRYGRSVRDTLGKTLDAYQNER